MDADGRACARAQIHYHMARVTCGDSFVRDCSVFDSNTRFVSIHGTHSVDVSRNVFFRSFGHGVYLEDGSEINNTIAHNLVVHARSARYDAVSNPRGVVGIFANGPVSCACAPVCGDFPLTSTLLQTPFPLPAGYPIVQLQVRRVVIFPPPMLMAPLSCLTGL